MRKTHVTQQDCAWVQNSQASFAPINLPGSTSDFWSARHRIYVQKNPQKILESISRKLNSLVASAFFHLESINPCRTNPSFISTCASNRLSTCGTNELILTNGDACVHASHTRAVIPSALAKWWIIELIWALNLFFHHKGQADPGVFFHLKRTYPPTQRLHPFKLEFLSSPACWVSGLLQTQHFFFFYGKEFCCRSKYVEHITIHHVVRDTEQVGMFAVEMCWLSGSV